MVCTVHVKDADDKKVARDSGHFNGRRMRRHGRAGVTSGGGVDRAGDAGGGGVWGALVRLATSIGLAPARVRRTETAEAGAGAGDGEAKPAGTDAAAGANADARAGTTTPAAGTTKAAAGATNFQVDWGVGWQDVEATANYASASGRQRPPVLSRLILVLSRLIPGITHLCLRATVRRLPPSNVLLETRRAVGQH